MQAASSTERRTDLPDWCFSTTVMQIKEVVLACVDGSLETALMLERAENQLLFATRDQKEGMQAFIGKRKPKFEGR